MRRPPWASHGTLAVYQGGSIPMNRAIWISASMALGLSAAFAQQPATTASTPCNALNRGTVNCPTYTAPATTAVPRASMGGSLTINGGISTPLFNGAVPPNGFMVQLNSPSELGNTCYVNDNGPANGNNAPPNGFIIGGGAVSSPVPFLFVTPPGYKPIGPVSIWCANGLYVEARGW